MTAPPFSSGATVADAHSVRIWDPPALPLECPGRPRDRPVHPSARDGRQRHGLAPAPGLARCWRWLFRLAGVHRRALVALRLWFCIPPPAAAALPARGRPHAAPRDVGHNPLGALSRCSFCSAYWRLQVGAVCSATMKSLLRPAHALRVGRRRRVGLTNHTASQVGRSWCCRNIGRVRAGHTVYGRPHAAGRQGAAHGFGVAAVLAG